MRTPRPALAALEAGIAHVARHHRILPPTAAASPQRRLALRVALNVVREFDTLLGHAVAETAAITGVVLTTTKDRPVRMSLAELARMLEPQAAAAADLARADRVREGLTRALASRRALEQHRLPPIYPHVIGATYRRIAHDLARLSGDAPPRGGSVRPAIRRGGDDAVGLPG